MARLLIDGGADINDVSGRFPYWTTLETAAAQGRLDVVLLLLERGANLKKDMRIYYVQSVMFAVMYGHHCVAEHLKQYGSWGERDQRLSDSLGNPDDHQVLVRYNEHTDVWDNVFDAQYSLRSSGDGSSDEDNISDDEVEGATEIVYLHHEPNCIPPTPRNGVDPTPTQSSHLDFANEHMAIYGFTSPWTLENNGVIAEIKGIAETGSVVQQSVLLAPVETNSEVPTTSTSHSIVSNHATGQVETWRPSVTTREDVSNFDMRDTNFADGQSMHSNFLDIEWEALITGASEFNGTNDTVWGFPIQEMPGFNMPDIDVKDGKSIPLDHLGPELEGPFASPGINDVEDSLLEFPSEGIAVDF
ncbi:hypothetical protein F4824DRAFT_508398 [Ustulina deusta]|nr:hypothetical protein F4824DRAFT_508398 [Ustulina deusta]